jgi:hypothetical protein
MKYSTSKEIDKCLKAAADYGFKCAIETLSACNQISDELEQMLLTKYGFEVVETDTKTYQDEAGFYHTIPKWSINFIRKEGK